jgi:hypothetical protein
MNDREASEAAKSILLELDKSILFNKGQAAAVVVLDEPPTQPNPKFNLIGWQDADSHSKLSKSLMKGALPIGLLVARPLGSPGEIHWEIGTGLLNGGAKLPAIEGLLDKARDDWHDRLRGLPDPALADEWYKYV